MAGSADSPVTRSPPPGSEPPDAEAEADATADPNAEPTLDPAVDAPHAEHDDAPAAARAEPQTAQLEVPPLSIAASTFRSPSDRTVGSPTYLSVATASLGPRRPALTVPYLGLFAQLPGTGVA